MYVVFGWNHFRIRSFDPYELGLTQKAESDFRIELRQSYFHFFWIPFFGLGKKWALRKNNQLYEMPAVFKDAIKGRDDLRVKSPWYTYTGPLLIIVILLGISVNQKVNTIRSNIRSEARFNQQHADNVAKFRKPSPDDYYILVAANGYSHKYARVTGLDKKQIQLTYITRTDVYAYQPFEIASAFEKYATETETISIEKGDSAKLIVNDYDKRENFEGIAIKDKYGTSKYRIERIARLDGPVFETASYGYGGKQCWMTVDNQGLETTISKIETLEGSVQWTPQKALPLTVKEGGRFEIEGKGNPKSAFKVKLTCTDASGNEAHYLWQGERNKRSVSKI